MLIWVRACLRDAAVGCQALWMVSAGFGSGGGVARCGLGEGLLFVCMATKVISGCPSKELTLYGLRIAA